MAQPSTLYHYCSIDTLIKIVTNKTLRLSNVFKMNDYSEVIHLLDYLFDALKDEYKLRKEKDSNFVITFEAFEGNDAIEKAIAFVKKVVPAKEFFSYILSFSIKSDDLGQWRAYGEDGTGVAIGFDIKILRNIVNILDQGDFNLDRVIYLDKSKNIFLGNPASSILDRLVNPDEKLKKELLVSGIKMLFTAAIQYKHNAFQNEHEYRLSWTPWIEDVVIGKWQNGFRMHINKEKGLNMRKISFINKDGRLTSYFDLNFEEYPKASKMIKKIILGPKSRISEDDSDLIMLFKINGFDVEKIEKSKLPYI